MKLTGIEKALKDGCRIHAFLSGGGLRVVRVEKNGNLKGYGEHPQVEDALSHANKDYLAGGRPYNKVYGKTKPLYLTGSSTSASPLDEWLLQGRTFDVWQDGNDVVFQFKGLTEVDIPKEIVDGVIESGESKTWEHRGYTYRITKSYFANGESGVSIKVIKSPESKKSGSYYYFTKTGHGKNFSEALKNALGAGEVEVEEE